jgi:hypothetical protein
MRGLTFTLLVGTAFMISDGALHAHHAFSMYEDRPTPLEGTVIEFKYINPHTYIIVRAKDENGRTIIWKLEGPSPASLAREGWSKTSLKRGDQIKTTVYPSREDNNSAVYYPRFTIFRDGRTIGGN